MDSYIHPTWLSLVVIPVVWRNWTPRPAVSPLSLPADVVTCLIDQSGAPGLVLGEVGLVPRALAVHGAVELEGEDAGLVGAGAADRDADRLWKGRKIHLSHSCEKGRLVLLILC